MLQWRISVVGLLVGIAAFGGGIWSSLGSLLGWTW